VKRYLPIILFLIGLLFFGGVIAFVKSRGSTSQTTEEESVAELPMSQRPFTSLSPTKIAANGNYGHWLTLNIKNINVPGAKTVEYLLEYTIEDGRTQGVPGQVELKGQDIQRDLLLGSESSGKFTYDKGVEKGKLTLKFRDSKGKLIGKLLTDFHLQTNTTEITSVDGSYKVTLPKIIKGVYFVTMKTFGGDENYHIFASDGKTYE